MAKAMALVAISKHISFGAGEMRLMVSQCTLPGFSRNWERVEMVKVMLGLVPVAMTASKH